MIITLYLPLFLVKARARAINGAILDNETFVYIDPQDDQIIRFDRYSLEWKLLEKNNDALVAAIINEVHIW